MALYCKNGINIKMCYFLKIILLPLSIITLINYQSSQIKRIQYNRLKRLSIIRKKKKEFIISSLVATHLNKIIKVIIFSVSEIVSILKKLKVSFQVTLQKMVHQLIHTSKTTLLILMELIVAHGLRDQKKDVQLSVLQHKKYNNWKAWMI